eukprot:scaffold110652_cov72-Phaeocystis_antarctica.AAC.3
MSYAVMREHAPHGNHETFKEHLGFYRRYLYTWPASLLQATGLGGARRSRPHCAEQAHRLGEGGVDLVRVEEGGVDLVAVHRVECGLCRGVECLVHVAVVPAEGRVERVVGEAPRVAERHGVAPHLEQRAPHALAHELHLGRAEVARLEKLAHVLLHVPQREE